MRKIGFGSASAGAGEKAWGTLRVNEDGKSVRIPVAVLNGSKPGPHMVFIANQHGPEINGFEAIRRLVAAINPKTMRGTVFCVPSMNPRAAMIMQKSWLEEHEGVTPRYDARFSVYDDPFNMNGNWPGRKGGTLAQRVIFEVWQRAVMASHRRADLVLDIHSHQVRTAVYARNKAGASLGVVAGCKFSVITGGEGEMNTCNGVCVRNGIMALTIEPIGQFRFNRDGVADALRAMKNLMKFWGMLRGRLELPAEGVVLDPWYSQCPWNKPEPRSCFTRYAGKAGLFFTDMQAYDIVRKGDVVCSILDPFTGRVLDECRAPMSGALVMLRWSEANAKKGDRLFTIAKCIKIKPSEYLERLQPDPEFYRFDGPAVRQKSFNGMP